MTTRKILCGTQTLVKAGVLAAPPGFVSMGLISLQEICNGCGAANAKFDFIPDRIWGTYIGHACHIHDWEYHHGVDNEDKEIADRTMRNNLLRLIDRDCKKKWYKPRALMHARAQLYYLAVCWKGGPAFWTGKN